jgi:hypothetical protein
MIRGKVCRNRSISACLDYSSNTKFYEIIRSIFSHEEDQPRATEFPKPCPKIKLLIQIILETKQANRVLDNPNHIPKLICAVML